MSLPNIHSCPCTLQEGFTGYSPAGQQLLFGSRSKKVSCILPFGPPGKTAEQTRDYNEKRKFISISGVQEKYSLLLQKNTLSLTGSRGTHILKPVPAERLELVGDMPANEHVSMQIARQVFNIRTAASGMIFFDDGSPAYITKRFDYKTDGTRYQVEDFATLLSRSPQKDGDNFKYNAAYIDMAGVIHQYVPAERITLAALLRLVVFNFLIGNGDAHLKNFSLMETDMGDFMLSPAYDLMCTSLHVNDAPLGLHDGLYPGDHDEKSYRNYGRYTGRSFIAFGEKIGLSLNEATKIVDDIMKGTLQAMELVSRSFLSHEAKKKYDQILGDRHGQLKWR